MKADYGEHDAILIARCMMQIKAKFDTDEVAGDPGFLQANDGSRSIKEELVRRAAHTGAVFRRNNQKFWVMLHAVTHETDAYNHVGEFAPTLNGRAAYFTLFAQYRGRGHFTNEHQAAVRVLATLHWNGKARGFTWHTFISRLIGAFNDLKLKGDPRSNANKVEVLLEKTVGDSSLSNGRSHITGDAVLQSNSQGAIDYLTTQVLQSQSKSDRMSWKIRSRGTKRDVRLSRKVNLIYSRFNCQMTKILK
ncbi:unnamed protein product [Cylindrotheca closterium]|uniref:Uncharacterized protein n=1 Tax=Cylindrotheca closterium TaxID=2856 RepID=A0AAD2PVJ0_9STRA|nr:unnamed protein product [Cylindrotheca closterium]